MIKKIYLYLSYQQGFTYDMPLSTLSSYQYCQQKAQQHYENFPVASWFLPKKIRQAISAIYAFARHADDIADDGSLTTKARYVRLRHWRELLNQIEKKQVLTEEYWAITGFSRADYAIFIALYDTIHRHHLPMTDFYLLLDAFTQDIEKKTYANFPEIIQYCRHSANPIGHLLLRLHGINNPRYFAYSDAICSALQLINFYQDIAQDYTQHQRIYLPQDEMQKWHITTDNIANLSLTYAMQGFMQQQFQRCQRLLQAGAPLGIVLSGRFALEIRIIIMAAARLLYHLQENPLLLLQAPRLTLKDKIWVITQALQATWNKNRSQKKISL